MTTATGQETGQRHRFFGKRDATEQSRGETLRMLRSLAGLRQYELAEMLDISGPYLSLIEGGHRPISDEMYAMARGALLPYLQRTARILGVAEEVAAQAENVSAERETADCRERGNTECGTEDAE